MNIAHLSDLHFGDHNVCIVNALLSDLELLKPDVIIISGDLTQRAHIKQFKQAQSFIQQLKSTVLIVPGNHDIPLYNPLYRLLYPFKRYKKYISPSLDTSFTNKEVSILGVNSATPALIKDGMLDSTVLKKIESFFASSSTRLNILFFHHNLKYFPNMHQPLINADHFLQYMQKSSIHMICTGHLHYANVHLIPKKNRQYCALVHAGSTFCQRTKDGNNSYYFIKTEQLTCTIDWRIFKDNVFKSHQTQELDFS